MKQPAVYIMTNKKFGTLYTGVTSNLPRRVLEHKKCTFQGFSNRYQCHLLVHYYLFETMTEAIATEKKLKSNSRLYKIRLIESYNPEWKDLPLV